MRRDDPPDRRRRGGPAPRGDRDAADRPRPAGDGLVAGRAAVRDARRPGPARAGADRLVVDGSTWSGDGLERLREMAELLEIDAPGDQRLRAGPAVALARGHRLDLRRSGLPAVPALDPPDRRHLRHPRRDGAHGSTNLVKPVYHVGWLASRLGLSRREAAARRWPGTARRRQRPAQVARGPARKPVLGRGPRRDAVATAGPTCGRRPPGRLDDAVGDDAAGRAARRAARLGAAGRRDRRGRDRPRPRLAGRRRGARPALPGAARRTEVDLLAEAIEAERPRPRRERRPARRRGAHRARRGERTWERPVADGRRAARSSSSRTRRAAARRGRPTDRRRRSPTAVAERGRADWATTGGSSAVGIYRRADARPPLLRR